MNTNGIIGMPASLCSYTLSMSGMKLSKDVKYMLTSHKIACMEEAGNGSTGLFVNNLVLWCKNNL